MITIRLFSFGYKYSGLPPGFAVNGENGAGGGFVFDCRGLPNPFWDETLRPFTGRDPQIHDFMKSHPAVAEFIDHSTWLVLNAVRSADKRGEESLQVAFGCTGGRHRSVYQAEHLRQVLAAAGHEVELHHMELDGPGTARGDEC